MDHNITIPIRAGQCISLFEKCPGRLGVEWAEDQCAHFKIWASNLGVFDRGHASIDYRLGPGGCHDRKSYDLTFQFVDCIFHNLRLVNQLAHEPAVIQELFSAAPARAPSSDIEDNANRIEPTVSSGVDEFAMDSSATKTEELRVACSEVEDSIRRLNTVAAKVRTAGPRYREMRSRRFKDIVRLETETTQGSADNTINRTEQFRAMITARIKYMFPEASDWLQERLSKAISLRRNYLAYLDRMERTIGKEASDKDDEMYDSSSSDASGHDELQSESEIEPSHSVPAPADFAADGVSFVARTEASTLSFQFGEGLNIPEPKDVSQDIFVCPYCRVTCDAEDSVGNRWRNHVIADLCPYICLYEDCATPNQCYASFREWIFHMEAEHVPREWVCHSRRHPDPLVFSDQHMFIKHISDSHSSTLTGMQLVALSQASSRPSCTLFYECPFGDEVTGRKQGEAVVQVQVALAAESSKSRRDDQKRILRHIGEHLQLLATMSLAWLGDETNGGGISQDVDALSSCSRISSTPPIIPESDRIAEEELKVKDDPAWNGWMLSADQVHKESREAEWSLIMDDKALTLYSGELEDPIMWEFMLSFGSTATGDRHNHVLLPPETSTTIATLETEPLHSRSKHPEDDNSDDQEERQQRRLLESSERLMKSIQQTLRSMPQTLGKEADATDTTALADSRIVEEPAKDTATDLPSITGKEEQPGSLASTTSDAMWTTHRSSSDPEAQLVTNAAAEFIDNRIPLAPAFPRVVNYDALREKFASAQVFVPGGTEFQVQMEQATHEFEQFLRSHLSIMPTKLTTGFKISQHYKPLDVAKMIKVALEVPTERESSQSKKANMSLSSVGEMWSELSKLQHGGQIIWLDAALLKDTASVCLCGAICLTISLYISRPDSAADILVPLPGLTEAVLAGGPHDSSFFRAAFQAENVQHGAVSLWKTMTQTLMINLQRAHTSSMRHRFLTTLGKTPRDLEYALNELQWRKEQLSDSIRMWAQLDLSNTRERVEMLWEKVDLFKDAKHNNKLDDATTSIYRSLYDFLTKSTGYPNLEQPSDTLKRYKAPDTSLDEALASLACDNDLADSEDDIAKCLRSLSQSFRGSDFQCSLDWVMNHKKLSTWLGSTTSAFLAINGRQQAILRRGPTTMACARLSQTLRNMSKGTEAVVISCLVGEHTNRGPAWLVRGMLGDALKAQPSSAIDADVLDSLDSAVMDSTRRLCAIFSKLIRGLETDRQVFVLVDGLSFYADPKRRKDAALLLKCLHGLCKPLPHGTDVPVIKVLVSENGHLPSSIAPENLAATNVLAVPDLVPIVTRRREIQLHLRAKEGKKTKGLR